MRDIILKLLNDYFTLGNLIRDVVVSENQGKQQTNIFMNLAASKWMLFRQGTYDSRTGYGDPDLDAVKKILEEERQTKAMQVFSITLGILDQTRKRQEWRALYRLPEPGMDSHHMEMINYSIKALFHTQVLTPFEYDISEPKMDESGILIGMKKLPKQKEGEYGED